MITIEADKHGNGVHQDVVAQSDLREYAKVRLVSRWRGRVYILTWPTVGVVGEFFANCVCASDIRHKAVSLSPVSTSVCAVPQREHVPNHPLVHLV